MISFLYGKFRLAPRTLSAVSYDVACLSRKDRACSVRTIRYEQLSTAWKRTPTTRGGYKDLDFVSRYVAHTGSFTNLFPNKCALENGLSQAGGALEVRVHGCLHFLDDAQAAFHLGDDALLFLYGRDSNGRRPNIFEVQCLSSHLVRFRNHFRVFY